MSHLTPRLWCDVGMSSDAGTPDPAHRSSATEIDQVQRLDRLAETARRTGRQDDQDTLWRETFGLDRWWCVPLETGEGGWAPAAGQIAGVNSLFVFSSRQRARRFAIDQGILAPDDPFEGAPTLPAELVRQMPTYAAAGIQALMVDVHRGGYFLPVEQVGTSWEQLRGTATD